jgi:hypothetical protein
MDTLFLTGRVSFFAMVGFYSFGDQAEMPAAVFSKSIHPLHFLCALFRNIPLYFLYLGLPNINNLFTVFFINCSRFQQPAKTMSERSYVGIDNIDNNEWVVVLWNQGKFNFSRPFKNTLVELEALVRFITERCERPKICLNPSNPNAVKLVGIVAGIPGVEVVLMSNAGLRLHLDWLPKDVNAVSPNFHHNSRRAYLLACCAERII